MEKAVKIGDVVISKAGRDKGEYFIVVDSKDGYAIIVDGKTRKVRSPKKKNVKHLQIVLSGVEEELALRILKGEPVGNERVKDRIKSQKQKIQED